MYRIKVVQPDREIRLMCEDFEETDLRLLIKAAIVEKSTDRPEYMVFPMANVLSWWLLESPRAE